MELDTSLTITSIIAVIALISPILTTFINNQYQLKIRKIEMSEKRYDETIRKRKEMFELYCQSLSQVAMSFAAKTEVYDKYAACYGITILYMTDEQVEHAKAINSLIHQRKFNDAHKLANDHILEIKEQIDMLNKVPK